MRLPLDECIGDRSLMEALLAASHDVVRSIDELGGGVDDPAVLAFACEHERVVVTYNAADFKLLADETPQHPGMLLIYQDNKPSDMRASDIVKALSNVERTYRDGIAGKTVVLNAFRW
jgi:predicted nuclease of predicted toxin-antitoxin system